jgi:DNA-binding transcriptional LysR family regulator
MDSRARLDLVRLSEYFLAVADEGHFGRGAESLAMSQPPLSQGIQRLESLLGHPLFVRGPRGAELTAEGRALVPRARDLVAAARLLVAPPARPPGAFFRLGIVPQLPSEIASTLVDVLRDEGWQVRVSVLSTAHAARALAERALDAGVLIHPCVLPRVAAGDVVRLPRDALIPDDHPLAEAGSTSLRDLAGLPLVLEPRSHGPAAHDLAADLAAVEGVPVAAVTAADDRQALLAVAGGGVMALATDPSIRGRGVARVALLGDPMPLRLRVAWPAARPLGALADALSTALGRS